MQRDFEPSYPMSVVDALKGSKGLQGVLLSGDVIMPDIETIGALSSDLATGVARRHKLIARHAISNAKNLRDGSFADRSMFGDGIVEELFIKDLLDESNRKPIVSDTDNNGILQGVLLELDRETEDSLSNMWDSIGQQYSSVYVLGARGGLAEEKAISVLRGTNHDLSAPLTPWFLKVGFTGKDQSVAIRENLAVKATSEQTPHSPKRSTPKTPPGVFQIGPRYASFIEHLRSNGGIANQSKGDTILNYEGAVQLLPDETCFIDTVGHDRSSNDGLLLVDKGGIDDYDGELLFSDPNSGLTSRLVIGRFIVHSVGSFTDDIEWVQIEELDPSCVEDVRKIITEEENLTSTLNRQMSIV